MEKPVGFRAESWLLVLEKLGSVRVEQLALPGALADNSGLLDHPELLSDTVMELEDDCEYVITETAARLLLARASKINLVRLYDRKKKVISARELRTAIRRSSVFDQLTRDKKEGRA